MLVSVGYCWLLLVMDIYIFNISKGTVDSDLNN